jgi:TRAP-type C4-dicarboxylate transport system substrate-binding protein
MKLLQTARLVALMCAAVATAGAAQAQQVTLKAVNAFQEGTYAAKNFEAWVKKVNDEGKGLVQVNYIGGPKAIPTFEQGNALRSGVVDISNNTVAYLSGIVPEANALVYTKMPMSELRQNGAIDYMNKLFLDKGIYLYARSTEGFQHYLYTNKKIDGLDFTGYKVRISPMHRDMFQTMNANVVQIPAGEVYTALERGVVDGYAWPLFGLTDLGWQEKTKYRVEPGFYTVEVSIYFNAKSWNKLSVEQKAFLEKQRAWLEQLNLDVAKADTPKEEKIQKDAGVQVIQLDPATAAKMQKIAYDSAWDAIVKQSPVNGQKLRDMIAPK